MVGGGTRKSVLLAAAMQLSLALWGQSAPTAPPASTPEPAKPVPEISAPSPTITFKPAPSAPPATSILEVKRIYMDSFGDLPLRFCRGWDIASTEKELVKDDPDFTVGTKSAFYKGNLYVADVRRGQWSTLKRDEIIVKTAREDGPEVIVRIEAVAGYVDTYKRIKNILNGVAVTRKTTVTVDKVTNASVLEPLFEGGKVFALKGAWNSLWESEFNVFPSGKKDDQVDSLVISAKDQILSSGMMSLSS